MCNGSCDSTKLSTGGTIAVLRPSAVTNGHLYANDPTAECDLLFHNSQDDIGGTRATFRTKNGSCFDIFKGHFMVIHRDGDVRNKASLSDEIRNALHTIEIATCSDATARDVAQMELPEALQLSVGGQGVIGRRVSIVTDIRDSGARVAEGIIGWN